MKAGVEEEDDRRGVTGGSDEDDDIGDEDDGRLRKSRKGSDERLAARLKEDAAEVGLVCDINAVEHCFKLDQSITGQICDGKLPPFRSSPDHRSHSHPRKSCMPVLQVSIESCPPYSMFCSQHLSSMSVSPRSQNWTLCCWG